jgi:spore coat protein U-like protein
MRKLRALLLALAALAAAPALATITCTITPAPSPLDFGSYTVLAQSATNVVFLYSCKRNVVGDSTNVEPWRIRLDTGSTSGAGGFINRTLFSGANAMLYQIYTDSAYSTIWGDTSGVTGQVTGSFDFGPVPVGGTVSTLVTGYGRVVANQDLNTGTYATTTAITATARLATGPAVIVTTTLSSQASLAANCLIDSASNIPFGVYNPLSGTAVDVTNATIVMRCTKNTTYTISLSQGNGGGFNPRKMDSAGANTDQLNYNLYTPGGGFTTIWGDGTGGTSAVTTTGTGILVSAAVTRTYNARLFAGQDKSADTYSDSVTVTVSY